MNHVSKRLSSALREAVKKAKTQKVTLGGKASGALTDKKISTLATYYRSAILRNQASVKAMQKDIMAALSHCSSTDAKPNHKQCPKGKKSWCFYNRNLAERKPKSHSAMSVFLNETVVKYIKPIYERLSTLELLQKCTKGLTQNANEAVHAVLWRKCSKSGSSSKGRIEIAAAQAIAEFNMGHLNTAKTLASVSGTQVTQNAQTVAVAKDRRRLRLSDTRTEPETKSARATKKLSAKRNQSKKVRLEGPTYGYGLFTE